MMTELIEEKDKHMSSVQAVAIAYNLYQSTVITCNKLREKSKEYSALLEHYRRKEVSYQN